MCAVMRRRRVEGGRRSPRRDRARSGRGARPAPASARAASPASARWAARTSLRRCPVVRRRADQRVPEHEPLAVGDEHAGRQCRVRARPDRGRWRRAPRARGRRRRRSRRRPRRARPASPGRAGPGRAPRRGGRCVPTGNGSGSDGAPGCARRRRAGWRPRRARAGCRLPPRAGGAARRRSSRRRRRGARRRRRRAARRSRRRRRGRHSASASLRRAPITARCSSSTCSAMYAEHEPRGLVDPRHVVDDDAGSVRPRPASASRSRVATATANGSTGAAVVGHGQRAADGRGPRRRQGADAIEEPVEQTAETGPRHLDLGLEAPDAHDPDASASRRRPGGSPRRAPTSCRCPPARPACGRRRGRRPRGARERAAPRRPRRGRAPVRGAAG